MSTPNRARQTSEVAAFRIERAFAATPEEVFDAWTSPAVLERWWGRPGWSASSFDVDLRVGGGYALRMLDADGKPHAVAGEYREIERPRRLVYTWCWREGGPDPGHVSLVTVEFRAGRAHDRRARARPAPVGGIARGARRRLGRRAGEPRAPDLRRGLSETDAMNANPNDNGG